MAIKKARVIFNKGLHFFSFTRELWIARATSDLFDDEKEDQIREKIWNNIKKNPKNPRLAITEDFVNALFDGYEESTTPNLNSIEDIKKIFIWLQHSPALRQWFNAIIYHFEWVSNRSEINFSEDFDPDELTLSRETLRKLWSQHKELLKVYAPKVFADRANQLFSRELNLKESEDELVEIFSCKMAHPDIEMTADILENLLNREKHNSQLEMSIAANPHWVEMLMESEWITQKSYPYLFAACELQKTIDEAVNDQGKNRDEVLVEQITSDDFNELEAYYIAQNYWDKISPYGQLGIIKSFFHLISFGYFFSSDYAKARARLSDNSQVLEAMLSYQALEENDKKDRSFDSFLLEYLRTECAEALNEKKNPLRSVVFGIADAKEKTEIFGKPKGSRSQDEYSVFSETYIQSLAATYSDSQNENQEFINAIVKKFQVSPDHFVDPEKIGSDEITHIIHLSSRSGLDADELRLVDAFKKACIENNRMLLRVISLAKDSRRVLIYLRSLNPFVSALIRELPNLENVLSVDDIRTLFRLKNKDIVETVFKEKRLADLVIQLASEFKFEKAAYKNLFELFTSDKALHFLTHQDVDKLCLNLHCTKVLFGDLEKSITIIFNLWKMAFAITPLASSAETTASSDIENDVSNINAVDIRNKIQKLFSAIDWRNLLALIEYSQEEQDNNIYELSDNFKAPMLTLIMRNLDNHLPRKIFSFIHPTWFISIFASLDPEKRFQCLSLMPGSDFQRFFDGDINLDNRSALSEMMKDTDSFSEFLTQLSNRHLSDDKDNILLSLLSDRQLQLPSKFRETVYRILEQHYDDLDFAQILNDNPQLKELIEEAKAGSCSY